jgi:DNA-directed RNA polymerase specialized sigma24 family protein
VVDELPEATAAGSLGGVDDRMVLIAALRRLPSRRRACLVLRYYEELSVRDTANASDAAREP